MIRVRVLKDGVEIASVELDPATGAVKGGGDGLDDLFGTSAPQGRSLLDHLEDLKVRLPFGCRAGSCGTCRVKVLAGAAALETPAPIEEDTVEGFSFGADVRLACRAIVKASASGDLAIELPKQ
jgi:ferredoxin